MTKLDELLAAAASDPARRPDFFDALLNAEVFVIGEARPAGNDGSSDLALARWNDTSDESFLPFFTSLQQLQKSIGVDTHYIALPARDLLSATRGSRLILNPGDRVAKEFLPEEVESLLLDGRPVASSSYSLDPGHSIRLGQPADYPHDLASSLAAFFAREPSVKRAFLALMQNAAADPEFSIIIGVEMSGDFAALAQKALTVAAGSTLPDYPVDFAPLVGGDDMLSDYFEKESKPFYERRKKGLFSTLFRPGRA